MSTQVFNLCTDTLAGLHVSGIHEVCMLMRRPGTPAEALFWQVNSKLTLIISVNCSFISVKRTQTALLLSKHLLVAGLLNHFKKKWLISPTFEGSENHGSIQPHLLCFSIACCWVEEVLLLLCRNPLWALNSNWMLHYSTCGLFFCGIIPHFLN